jgi:hypothetical protein
MKVNMSDMIERVGLLLRAADEQRQRLEEIEAQENAQLGERRAQTQKRIEEMERDLPKLFREIADVYPGEFSCNISQDAASQGRITCELVWTKKPPRRHLRVILVSTANQIQVQWLREGLKDDYVRKVDVAKFDAAYLDGLVTDLVSSKRWGQGFYPII